MISNDINDKIALISLNSAPVNALNHALRAALQENLQRVFNDPGIEAVVLGSALPLFSAGADIQEFKTGNLWQSPDLLSLCALIENAPKLVIAAINGTAMGGALELALSCDYRIGLRRAVFGLPEIKLGLLPGAGGSQKLPRITNLQIATDMILSGNPIEAKQALAAGLLDKLVDDNGDFDFNTIAIEYAQDLLDANAAQRNTEQMSVTHDGATGDFFARLRQSMAVKTRGQVAPERCLQSIEAAVAQPLSAGLAQERAGFIELLETPQARAMIHLFFAERDAQKVPGVSRYTGTRDIESVGVLGAGTMGAGITILLVDAGIPVVLVDMSEENLSYGLTRINNHYQRAVGKGRLSLEQLRARMRMVTCTLEFDDLANADLVIEAVFENIGIKKAIFEQLDNFCKPGAILASNTSTLDLNVIAAATGRPEDVIGMHFFSPANVMRLLEVVRGEKTSPEVIQTALKLGKQLRKIPVVVKVCFGFVGNRMLEPYFREASRLMLEGAMPEQIDRVLTDFGMAMGVIAMGDLAGIDVGYKVRQSRRDELALDPTYQAVQDKLYALGRYGQKTGRGSYLYNGRAPVNDPEVKQLCESLASKFGIQRRAITDEEILERCLYPLINEGYRILDEGIAYRSGDCDLIWVNGYGFPAWRGGPMHYATEIGPARIHAGMQKYRRLLGDYGELWFQSAELLEREAESRPETN